MLISYFPFLFPSLMSDSLESVSQRGESFENAQVFYENHGLIPTGIDVGSQHLSEDQFTQSVGVSSHFLKNQLNLKLLVRELKSDEMIQDSNSSWQSINNKREWNVDLGGVPSWGRWLIGQKFHSYDDWSSRAHIQFERPYFNIGLKSQYSLFSQKIGQLRSQLFPDTSLVIEPVVMHQSVEFKSLFECFVLNDTLAWSGEYHFQNPLLHHDHYQLNDSGQSILHHLKISHQNYSLEYSKSSAFMILEGVREWEQDQKRFLWSFLGADFQEIKMGYHDKGLLTSWGGYEYRLKMSPHSSQWRIPTLQFNQLFDPDLLLVLSWSLGQKSSRVKEDFLINGIFFNVKFPIELNSNVLVNFDNRFDYFQLDHLWQNDFRESSALFDQVSEQKNRKARMMCIWSPQVNLSWTPEIWKKKWELLMSVGGLAPLYSKERFLNPEELTPSQNQTPIQESKISGYGSLWWKTMFAFWM